MSTLPVLDMQAPSAPVDIVKVRNGDQWWVVLPNCTASRPTMLQRETPGVHWSDRTDSQAVPYIASRRGSAAVDRTEWKLKFVDRENALVG